MCHTALVILWPRNLFIVSRMCAATMSSTGHCFLNNDSVWTSDQEPPIKGQLLPHTWATKPHPWACVQSQTHVGSTPCEAISRDENNSQNPAIQLEWHVICFSYRPLLLTKSCLRFNNSRRVLWERQGCWTDGEAGLGVCFERGGAAELMEKQAWSFW